ncbi:MAG: hypothetical protein AB7I45_01460 [Planctomycetota bacterium]
MLDAKTADRSNQMARPKPRPAYLDWRVITTLDEFEEIAWLVIKGEIPFAMVQAAPGVAKTDTIDRLIRRAKRRLGYTPVVTGRGTASAKGFFRIAQEHKDVPIIGDDMDVALNKSDELRALVRALTDSGDGPRTLTWDKEMPDLARRFETLSPFLLIFNALNMAHPEIAAIVSRAAIKVRFAPPAREVQDRAQYRASVQEVFDFWSRCLPFMSQPNFRCLANAERLHASTARLHDWRTAILDDVDLLPQDKVDVLVAHLGGNYKNTKRLFEEFVEPHPRITASQRAVYDWINGFEETWSREIAIGLRVRGRPRRPVDLGKAGCKSANLQDCSPSPASEVRPDDEDQTRKAVDDVFREMGLDDWPREDQSGGDL